MKDYVVPNYAEKNRNASQELQKDYSNLTHGIVIIAVIILLLLY